MSEGKYSHSNFPPESFLYIYPVKILLVEDDRKLSALIEEYLSGHGYIIDCLYRGDGVLAHYQQHPADLLILDLMLPGISGEEICKSIREHDDETIQKIPIIMLTAKSSEVDGIVGRVIGANYYMTKPFYMEDLVREIERLTQPV